MDVFRQRLEDEYDANVIITAPTVPYKSVSSLLLGLLQYRGLRRDICVQSFTRTGP